MPDYEKAGVELELEHSRWDTEWNSIQSDVADAQQPIEMEVSVNADLSGISEIDDIPTEAETELNVNESDEAKQAFADIHFMALKDKIETVWNFVGNVWDLAGKLNETFVAPLLDIDEAVAHINAQTGGTGIADLNAFIREVQRADLGDSVDQISDVVIAAKQLGAPIEEATMATLTFTHAFTDQNPVDVMTTLKSMADEFGISITEASDLMTVFFQQSGNKGGDALAAVNRYSTSWHDMGLSISEALSLVSSLMAGGVDTADAAAKMIQTFDDSFTTAATDPNSQQAKMLAMMGIANPKDSGQAIGAETIDGFVTAFTNLPADQQDLASQLFFGKGGKLNTSAIEAATTQGTAFGESAMGAALEAATEFDNSLKGAIDDFVTAINTSITDFLSSDAVDLDGFITRLKDGFQAAVGVLTGGGTIGEALEIGFNIQGFDTTVANLERIFGNFEIIILQAIMAVQRLRGMDTTDIGNQITDLAKGQLSFDLKIANEDEIPTIINQAMTRGVDASGVVDAAKTAFDEAIASGDFDVAQSIIDGMMTASSKNGGDTTKMAAIVQPWADALQTAMTEATSKLSFGPQQTGTSPLTSSLFGGTTGAGATGGMFGDVTAALDGVTTAAQTATTNTQTSFDNLALNLATPVGTVVSQIDSIDAAGQSMDQGIANALTGNTVTTSFETMAESARENAKMVIVAFTGIIMIVSELDFMLGNILRRFEAIQTAATKLQNTAIPVVPPTGGGNTTNNNTNVNINVGAAPGEGPTLLGTMSQAYAIGSSIRGFG